MKLLKIGLTTFVLLCLCIQLCPIAHAASFSIVSEPGELESAGNVKVIITVVNTSQYSMDGISIMTSSGTHNFPNYSIAPGSTQPMILASYYVSESEIGKEIPFYVRWKENDASKSKMIYLVVPRAQSPAESPEQSQEPGESVPPNSDTPQTGAPLTLEYSADKSSVEMGGQVTFTYNITNISDHTVSGITLTDPNIAGQTQICSNVSLTAGGTHTVTYIYTMGNVSVTAAPVVSYASEEGTKTITCNQKTIECVTVQMDVSVSMGETTASGTDFIITVANNGSKPISGVTIQDDAGAQIAQGETLSVGETREFNHNIQPTITREVFFTISGMLSTGETRTVTTNKYPVWEYTDPSLIGITFGIEVVEPLNQSGSITIRFTAENTGAKDMSGLSIAEEQMGLIGTMNDLPIGGTVSVSYSMNVGSPRDLSFILTASDPSGKPWEFNTVVAAGDFGSAANPVGTPNTDNINVGSAIMSLLANILKILAVIAALSGIALIVLAVLEKRAVQSAASSGFGRLGNSQQRKSKDNMRR